MKRTLQKVFSLLLCAAIMVVPAFAAGESGEVTGTPSPVMVWGNLTWLDGGGLLLKNDSDTALSEVVLHGESIICLDAVTGDPMDIKSLKDGDTVYVDSGTSCTALLRHLVDRDVTIYTGNGSACYVTGAIRAHVLMLGGEYNPQTLSVTGPITERILGELYFDKSFLGVNAVSVERGVTNPSFDEAAKKKLVRQNSEKTYVLCDSSKFHRVSNVKVFDLEGLTIISDATDDHLIKHVPILTPGD